MLNLVDVVARKIIGSGDIKTGIHSTAARTGPYITAAFSSVQKASAQDWATSADFFVSYSAFVIFKAPTSPQDALSRGTMVRGAMAEGAADDVRQMALRNYTYEPL
jgi:hypothetical protein